MINTLVPEAERGLRGGVGKNREGVGLSYVSSSLGFQSWLAEFGYSLQRLEPLVDRQAGREASREAGKGSRQTGRQVSGRAGGQKGKAHQSWQDERSKSSPQFKVECY
ncbi:hypothetical protein E2C01_076025 [Portunus trituberculatus]|uniref:Uncharacterized protein n=1 Tax=Portunus trituberculatus TaxID=210409 RepID=A0A5B7IAB5_PORTR|nr:hypothetical protein [Portunus trituberculatus]